MSLYLICSPIHLFEDENLPGQFLLFAVDDTKAPSLFELEEDGSNARAKKKGKGSNYYWPKLDAGEQLELFVCAPGDLVENAFCERFIVGGKLGGAMGVTPACYDSGTPSGPYGLADNERVTLIRPSPWNR